MAVKFRRLSPKLIIRYGLYMNPFTTHAHWCPACAELHDFAVDAPFTSGNQWKFDGDPSAPTFAPSMNIAVGPFPKGSKRAGEYDRCHYILEAGKLKYQNDCTHEFAGKTVDLPDIPHKALAYMPEMK